MRAGTLHLRPAELPCPWLRRVSQEGADAIQAKVRDGGAVANRPFYSIVGDDGGMRVSGVGRRDRRPVSGYAVLVRLADVERVLWWGSDDRGIDVVATCGGRVLSWSSSTACTQSVEARGWDAAESSDTETTVMDLRALVEWVRRARLALDVDAALNAWNLADDVAASLDLLPTGRGTLADLCHAKLTAANVPWLFGRSQYRPRWSPHQERYLRQRLTAAVLLLRSQLTNVPDARPCAVIGDHPQPA
jgi:hypothetical protein